MMDSNGEVIIKTVKFCLCVCHYESLKPTIVNNNKLKVTYMQSYHKNYKPKEVKDTKI